MSASNGVVIMTADPATTETVRAVVAARARFVLQGSYREPIGLAAALETAVPAAVLVDIDADPVRLLDSLEPLAARFDQTRFIVISREVNGEWVLHAMRAGARQYLVKAALADELGPTLERLVPESRAHTDRTATIVTVLSAGGGVGTTTFSINVANELRIATEKPSLLVDLDRSYAAIASYLGLEGRYGVAEILGQGERLDADLVKSTALRYSDGLDVLISNPVIGPGETLEPDYGNLPRLVEVSSALGEAVVIDGSRVPAPAIVPLVDMSTATLLLLRLNVVHLRSAKSMMTALSEHGISPSSIIPVASHYHKRRSVITLADAQRALFDRPLGTLSDDEASAAAAANYGQPLAECAPRSTLRKEIRAFAERVLGARKANVALTSW